MDKKKGAARGENVCSAVLRCQPHRFLYCLLHFLPVPDRGIGNCKFVYCRRRRVSKKRTSRGKDWGIAINPRRRKSSGHRRRPVVFSFATKSSERTSSLELFYGFCFPSRERQETSVSEAGEGMIFNELKAHLSQYLRRETTPRAKDALFYGKKKNNKKKKRRKTERRKEKRASHPRHVGNS